MKAAVYYETGDPSVLKYEDVPDPTCHPRGVVIAVEAISIEGGDVLARAGGALATTPHITGYQNAGTIVEVGAAVTDREVGQRVVALAPFGSHASMRSVPVQSTWLIPDELSIEEGAAVPVAFGTADDCLFEFGLLSPDETVLVQGAGGAVGLAAVQLAKRAGARVFGTASTNEKLNRLTEYDLDEGINYRDQDLVQAVRELTDGRGVDVVVDPVGGEVLGQSLACLAPRGRCISVGNASRGKRDLDPSQLGANRTLTSVSLAAEMGTDRVYTMIAAHLRDIVAGELRVVIDSSYPLDQAAEAHAHIESRAAFGRVILTP